MLRGYLNFRGGSGKAHISFPRIEILTTDFSPSNGGEHRGLRGKFLEKNMTFWRPSCFLVWKPLTLVNHSPVQDSATLKVREAYTFFHPVTTSVLLSGISTSLILSFVLNPPQSVHFCKVVQNWVGRQTPLTVTPQVSSCEANSFGEKEIGMAEAWFRKGPTKPWLIIFLDRSCPFSNCKLFDQGYSTILFYFLKIN